MGTTVTLRFQDETSADDCELPEVHFRPVTADDISLLTGYFKCYPSRSCDFSVGGVIIWSDYFDYEIAETEGTLLIMGKKPDDDTRIFHYPCGPMDYQRFSAIVRDYCQIHKLRYIILEPYESQDGSCADDFSAALICADDWKEYLYDIEQFVSFSGRKMEKKRNHLNFFVNNYSPFTVSVIRQADFPELISFTVAFSAAHSDNTLALYECRQIAEVLRHYDNYPFFGIIIRVNNEIVGYTFGEKLGDTFFIHVEKGNIEYRGVYQALSSRLAVEIASRYADVRYLNREDDMGNESLKRSKESYHPTLYINKIIRH